MDVNDRRIWQMPWGYSESVIIVCGIVIVGFLLQITIGSFNFYLLASPANLFIGAVIIILCIASLRLRNSYFIRWFTGVRLSVCLITALLILSLIMGLSPQDASSADNDTSNILANQLGFNNMTSSWAFVLVYFVILLSLGCLIVRKFCHFQKKDCTFYMNHTGLWFVLFAAGLGYADMERYIMHVLEGEIEWRVYDDNNNVKELPIAIQLNDFDMEEYPPKLTVIDRVSGIAQPGSNPDYYQIDSKNPKASLNGWNIELEQYIHQAVRNSDSAYREAPMPGATPAAKIKAVNMSDGKEAAGWVCGGNQAQLYMTLPLNEHQCVVMTVAEPKRFMSDIEVYTPDGLIKKALLEVNKPLRAGSWTIYQYGYDNKAGRLSSYSSIELVYDPWAIPVYIGFIMIALGAVVLIWNGRFIKRAANTNNSFSERDELE
jgi:hypothetical protein